MIPEAVPRVGVKVRMNEPLWPAAIVVRKDNPPRLNSGLVEVAEEIFTLDACGAKSGPEVLTGWRHRLGVDLGGWNGLSCYWGLNPTPIGPLV